MHQVVNNVSSPICFLFRKLLENEQRYSTFDRELLALFAAVRKWKDFVSGHSVTAITDHKPLVGAINNGTQRQSDRQQRQLSFISEFISKAIYLPGKENIVADALSRAVISSIDVNEETTTNTSTDLISLAYAQFEAEKSHEGSKLFEIEKGINISCETSQPHPRPIETLIII